MSIPKIPWGRKKETPPQYTPANKEEPLVVDFPEDETSPENLPKYKVGDIVNIQRPTDDLDVGTEYMILEIMEDGTIDVQSLEYDNSIINVDASELLMVKAKEEKEDVETEKEDSFENKFNSFIEKHNQKIENRLKPNIKENKLGGIKGFLERIGKTYQGSAIHSRLISGAATTLALGASAFANTNPVAFWGLNTIRAVLSTYSGSMAGKAVVLANQERNIESKLIKNEDGTLGVDLEKLSPQEQAKLLAELTGYASGKAQKIDSAAYKKSQEELNQKTEGRLEGRLNKIRNTFQKLNPASKVVIAGAVMTGNVVLTRLLGPWGAVAATGINILYSKISTDKVDGGEYNKYSEVIEKLSNSLDGYVPTEEGAGTSEELYDILEKQNAKVEGKQRSGAVVGGIFGAALSIWSTSRAYGKSLAPEGHTNAGTAETKVASSGDIGENKGTEFSKPQRNPLDYLDNPKPHNAPNESLKDIIGNASKESGAPMSTDDFNKLLHDQPSGIHSGFDYTKAFSAIDDSSYHSAGKISESDLKNIVLNPGKHIPSGVLDPLKEKIASGKIDLNSLKLVANKDHVGEIQLKYAEWVDGKPVLKGIPLEHPEIFKGHPGINDITEATSHTGASGANAADHLIHQGHIGAHETPSTSGNHNHQDIQQAIQDKEARNMERAMRTYNNGFTPTEKQLNTLLDKPDYQMKLKFAPTEMKQYLENIGGNNVNEENISERFGKYIKDGIKNGSITGVKVCNEPDGHLQLKYLLNGKLVGTEINHKATDNFSFNVNKDNFDNWLNRPISEGEVIESHKELGPNVPLSSHHDAQNPITEAPKPTHEEIKLPSSGPTHEEIKLPSNGPTHEEITLPEETESAPILSNQATPAQKLSLPIRVNNHFGSKDII